MAATLWAGEQSLVSHRAAGVLWGLDGVLTRRVEVTVPRDVDRRCSLVVLHRTGLIREVDRTEIGGIPVTTPVRTLVDLAGAVRPRELELAVEDVFRRQLASPDQLACAIDELCKPGRQGSGALRRLVDQRDGHSESGWEIRLRRLLVEHGLPTPVAQHEVLVRGQTYRLDLAYPASNVALEFDSLRWHTGRERLESDSMRRNLLHDAGWHLVHVTARMLRERPEHVVALVRSAIRGDSSREMCN
jgi:very-short-patch-repair endonuclease